MKVLLTGSAGHLGEALARTLKNSHHDVIGLDIRPSAYTGLVGSIADRSFVKRAIKDAKCVLHTASLHKPHIATHCRQEFVATNITGTLNLLEESIAAGIDCFVFTSTTSVFGEALRPASGAPSAWITEGVTPIPKNIYGVTKKAAEDLCELFSRQFALPCLVLRTSRFFPDEDDDDAIRQTYDDDNVKVNEYLYRRVDLQDVVTAHVLALERARSIGFGRYIISATTPFSPDEVTQLRTDAPSVVSRLYPEYEREYARRDWKMFPGIDRVYVNDHARGELGWRPRYNFEQVLERLRRNEDPRSSLSRSVGFKGYHVHSPHLGKEGERNE